MEMTNGSDQKEFEDEEMSYSDSNSPSLLQDLPARQTGDAAKNIPAANPGPRMVDVAMEIGLEVVIDQLTPHVPEISSGTQSAAGGAVFSSKPAKAKKKNKKNLYRYIKKFKEPGDMRLHKACKERDLVLVKKLIKAGVIINWVDYAGWTALHEACVVGDVAVVEQLLTAGAHVNVKSPDDTTPLHYAVCSGNYQLVQLLLQNGSNPNDKNIIGLSALDMAGQENIKELLMTFQAPSATQETSGVTGKRRIPPVEILRKKRRKIPAPYCLHKTNMKGETYIHKACKQSDPILLKMFIEGGVSVNAEDNSGWTALHEASALGDEAVVEELLKAGAHVNTKSFDGRTPLHDAVLTGNYQLVQLLLQNGSNPNDQDMSGLSALDMAEQENIKELLMTFQTSSATRKTSGVTVKQRIPPGATASVSEVPQNFSRSCSDSTNLPSRQSDDTDGTQQHNYSQQGAEDIIADNATHSTALSAVTTVLEEVRKKQIEMSVWPVTDLNDAGCYLEVLTQIQRVLSDVLTKQRLEKEDFTQEYRRVPDSLVLKSQFISLASRQRSLMEILQKQIHLEEAYHQVKAKLSTQPPNHEVNSILRQQPYRQSAPVFIPGCDESREAGSCHQDSNQSQSLSRSLLTQDKRFPTHPDLQNDKASSCQSTPQLETTVQHVSLKMKGQNALIQTRAEDDGSSLCRLIQEGVLVPGNVLLLVWKEQKHYGYVQADGSIKRKGELYPTLERWVEYVSGNNIPVSATYALKKVKFRGKPLSYYLQNIPAKILQKQIHPEEACHQVKAKLSIQPPNHEVKSIRRQQPYRRSAPVFIQGCCESREAGSCHQDSNQSQSLSRSLLTQDKRFPTHPDLQNDKASSCQSTPQLETTVQHVSLKMKGQNALIQTRAEDNSSNLCRLIQEGVVAPGNILLLVWKGKKHHGYVQADGTIKRKGELYPTLERWVEFIFGNNIPVSATYALEMVKFRGKPLSYYLRHIPPKDDTSHTCFEKDDDFTQEELIPEARSPNQLLKKIKTIHLVDDDELVPSAILDFYWDKLLNLDLAELDNWETEL